jgi:hypothetical protein
MGPAGQGCKLRRRCRPIRWFAKDAAFEAKRLISADHEPARPLSAGLQSLGARKMQRDSASRCPRGQERSLDRAFIDRRGTCFERDASGCEESLPGHAF